MAFNLGHPTKTKLRPGKAESGTSPQMPLTSQEDGQKETNDMSEARTVDDNYEGPDRLRLKIPIGKSAIIRCVGKPIAFDDTFEDKETGEKTVKEQYARIVIVRDTKDGDSVRGFKYGWQVFKGIRSLAQKATWGDPSEYDIEVENNGTLPDYWKVTPVGKSPITNEERNAVIEANIDLGVLFMGKKKGEETDPYQ